MDDWNNLEHALAGLLTAGNIEVHEDGEWLAELAGLHCELRRDGKHRIIHFWSEDRNLVRRILRVSQCTPERVTLEIQRFGRAKPGRLEILRADAPRPARRVSREKFRARFRRMLAEQFPDGKVASLTTAPDLEHSFSGVYSRGLLVERGKVWAVLGVSGAEDASAVDGALTFGLLWLDRVRESTAIRARGRAVQGLRLFLPAGSSRVSLQRLAALAPSAHVEVYEFSDATWGMERREAASPENIEGWLTPRREVEGTLRAARDAIEKIRALAPDAIDAVVPPGTREVELRFRGLEFARWGEGRILFGPEGDVRELTGSNGLALEEIVRELALVRNSQGSSTNHPLYRARPERWLETLVQAEPARIDARLDPRRFYSQVPAMSAGDRGVIDLLGVTREGRLVIVELKAGEDIHLPLQAVDYWLRVRRHQRAGDFPRYGYFSDVQLDARPPLLWLVAPGLRFHPSTETLLRYLSPEIEVSRIGLNEDWRGGPSVVFRM
jgi:hypothetical protein